MIGHRLEYRPDIQGLRAVAVLMVVLGHAGVSGFAGGFAGVDVFFVLSGFLITGLLQKELSATGKIAYGQFLVRRIRRLLPALLLMLVVVLLAATCILEAYELEQQTLSFPFALAWISNLYFAFAEHQYFEAIRAQDLFIHTWSLGVEEQFYLFWPLLLIVTATFVRRCVSTENHLLGLAIAFALVSAGSIALNVHWYPDSQSLSFYMMPTRAWQFALGASAYLVTVSMEVNKKRYSTVPGLLAMSGLVLLAASAGLLHENLAYPGLYALAPSMAAGLLVVSGALAPGAALTRLLAAKQLVWVGDRSYSLYLWHWPVLVLGNAYGLFENSLGLLLYVGISMSLATASYRFAELPLWKGGFRKLALQRVLLGAMFSAALAFGLFSAVKYEYFQSSLLTVAADEYNPRTDRPRGIYDAERECDSGIRSASLVPCDVGGEGGIYTAVLLGDSIGAQWTPMLRELLDSSKWRIQVLTKSACAIVDETWYYDVLRADYTVCTEWRESAIEYLSALQPELLVIGSSAEYELSDAQWTDGTTRILERVSTSADNVIILPGTIRLSFDGPSCLQNPARFGNRKSKADRECAERSSEPRAVEVAGHLERAASRFANVHVVLVHDLVCPDGICAAESYNGTVVYRDTSHLTARFVRSLADDINRRIEAAGVVIADHQSYDRD